MTIAWDPAFSVGVKIIDSQHIKFLTVLNEVYRLIEQNIDDTRVIDSVFVKLEAYIIDHFATEEKYFQQFNYPNANQHKRHHRQFIAQIKHIKQKIQTNQKTDCLELVDTLEKWFLKHVTKEDMEYVECFSKHGLF